MLLQRRLGFPEPTFAELFTPKLVTILREGYGPSHLRADALAGLTVAIVALPLSMAIAIASGATPDRGLYTAIVGGFLISLLGGSRFQIGGPAGAFIVLVAAVIDRHGFEGLTLATMMAGLMLAAIGLLRLGTYIKYIPHPLSSGSRRHRDHHLREPDPGLLGLDLGAKEPAACCRSSRPSPARFPPSRLRPAGIAGATIALIVGLRRLAPALPNLLIAVVTAAAATAALGLEIETIGSRFGGIPSALPLPSCLRCPWPRSSRCSPTPSRSRCWAASNRCSRPWWRTDERAASPVELRARGSGVANVASGLFGGIPVTGTIARTATNVRAGAVGPVAGMLHALFLLAFMMLAAPLAAYVPLAALAGVLAVVAWNMAERHEVIAILRAREARRSSCRRPCSSRSSAT
jgi:SulP family sulfate permease